jgi:putative hydrolase of the HAD superfamily
VQLPAAILLDLDDTIVAFDAVADDCWRSLCGRYAPELGRPAEALFAAISRSRKWFWSDEGRHRTGRLDLKAARRQVVARAFEDLGFGPLPVAVQLADAYSREREQLVAPFPGAVETIVELRQRGIDLALVTNGEAATQRAKIERFDLARHFGCIVIEGEFGVGKPDAAVFTHALRSLGHPPQNAWMIGDSLLFDVTPAVKLGMRAILIDRTRAGLSREIVREPVWTIATLAEILADQPGDDASG